MLPILAYRDRVRQALASHASVIITAPPGTGKSTQVPRFFLEEATPRKRIIVLEPRRIAARTLAYRVAGELGNACGDLVGYQVRFERKATDRTCILFLTYGTFLQLLQSDPLAARDAIIIFDEFHERTLDADAAFAWVRALAGSVRRDLRLMVLSATLETGPLRRYCTGSEVIEVGEKMHPVEIFREPPKPRETVAEQVGRAFSLMTIPEGGSVLAFLPGVYEIERAAEILADPCRRRKYRLLCLHGRMQPSQQQEVLDAPAREQCVILSTNVAETSLTIPGVTAVIDSGLARLAAYDPDRDRNTLYVSRISLQNAAQRAGRAGRLTKGVCVRLYTSDDERAMPETVVPEIVRLDLARTALMLSSYADALPPGCERPQALEWLTPPPPERWTKARDDLNRCGALEPGGGPDVLAGGATPLFHLTTLGKKISRLPLEPAIAAILLHSKTDQERRLNAAMAALWESGDTQAKESNDLYAMAAAFLADLRDKTWGREAAETFDQLHRMMSVGQVAEKGLKTGAPLTGKNSEVELRETVARSWLRTFSHRIAARESDSSLYRLADGRSMRLVARKNDLREPPGLILALAIHERGGRDQKLQASVPLYLPLTEEMLTAESGDIVHRQVVCTWDDAKKRVLAEETRLFRGMVLGRKPVADMRRYAEQAADCLAERLRDGVWNWQADDQKAEQFLFRIRCAAAAYPEMRIPKMDREDLELVYHDLSAKKSSLDEVQRAGMLPALKSYLGSHLSQFIEKKAPDMAVLPSGKKGRVTYFDGRPPELSARITDFIGHKDRFALMDGRVQGVFNILAPNYRTVQKTVDLGSFWRNTYPSIKNELKRKYPRHPWP